MQHSVYNCDLRSSSRVEVGGERGKGYRKEETRTFIPEIHSVKKE